MNIAIIFAGGVGSRMKTEIPKQFLEINGKPILVHTLEIFQYHDEIDKIYISTLKDYIPYVYKLIEIYKLDKVEDVVQGGSTSQDSIYNALNVAYKKNNKNDVVLLHDGVRPFVESQVITNNIKSVKEHGNAITAIPAYETTIISKNGQEINDVTTRREVYIGQAPQSFFLGDIIEYHDEIRKLPERYEDMVDACTIARKLNKKVYIVKGNRGNIKITTPEDVYTYKAFLNYKENEQTFGLGKTNSVGSQFDLIRGSKNANKQ